MFRDTARSPALRFAAHLGSFLITISSLLLPGATWAGYAGVAGPGPVAPAPNSPERAERSGERYEPAPPLKSDRSIERNTGDAASVMSQPEPQTISGALIQRANFNGIDGPVGHLVPDPSIAAGPGSVILSTNPEISIRGKTGAVIASKSLGSFFGPVRAPGESSGDPMVIFDPSSNRFFVAAAGSVSNSACTPGTCVSHFLLAASKTSNPNSLEPVDWYFYAFDATLDGSTPTANLLDFPRVGVDARVVVIAGLMLKATGGAFSDRFQYAKIRVFDKSKLIRGEPVTWTDFVRPTDPMNGGIIGALQPALTFGDPGPFFLVSRS